MNPDTEIAAAQKLAVALRNEWACYVRLAWSEGDDPESIADEIEKASGTSARSIQRRIDAILHAKAFGLGIEDVIQQGQRETVAAYEQSRRVSRLQDQVQMRFVVPGSLREAILADFDRIRTALSIGTSEGLFEFLHSLICGITDEELKHLAGKR